MTYCAIMPVVYQLWADRALKTCDIDVQVVDNTQKNIGVSASWNIGARKVIDEQLDWLIIMSAALRFGDARGIDFLEELLPPSSNECIAIEAAHGVGWHLIGFPRFVLEDVGLFDEGFYPAYFEDLDFSRRIALRYNLDPPYWKKVSVDVAIAGFAHGVDLANVAVDNKKLVKFYEEKWGGPPGKETYQTPYNR